MQGIIAIYSMLVVYLGSVHAEDTFDISSAQKYIENIQQSLPAINESDIPAWVDEWKAPKILQKLFPCYISGYDLDGSPVYVMEFGRWKYAEAITSIKDGPEKAFDLFVKYQNQIMYSIYRDGLANDGQGVVIIVDYDGFAISNYANPSTLKAALTGLAGLERVYKVLNYAFLINMNFVAENLIGIARPLMGNFLEKCEIFGSQKSKWLPHLARKIPTDQLSPWYGGPEDWQPVTIGLEPFNSTQVKTAGFPIEK